MKGEDERRWRWVKMVSQQSGSIIKKPPDKPRPHPSVRCWLWIHSSPKLFFFYLFISFLYLHCYPIEYFDNVTLKPTRFSSALHFTVVQTCLATHQALCVCVGVTGRLSMCMCLCVCVYLAEVSASLNEQMVLQQVIMTQDKPLNWLSLCEGRVTKFHCQQEREGDVQSLNSD